jgi:hypothetical protein
MSIIGSNLLAGASGQGGYEIERSLRFNDDDTAYLNQTPSSAGNRKTWTWSCWVKRANLGTSQEIFNAASGPSSQRSEFRFNTSDELQIGFNPTGSTWYYLYTDAKYRDVSAWYHVVLIFDTTQATSSNRTKLYVNGSLQSFRSSSYLPQNTDGPVNNNIAHAVGRYQAAGSAYFDGYIAEAHFIDSTALDVSDFGETDTETGAWIPKKYSGSYGTNGFYLNFSDNSTVSALGTDTSGNGNDWTPNNFSVNDCCPDSPTNNFCTLNPLDRYSSNNISTSEGNLEWANSSGGSYEMIRSTQAMQSGKWYAEYVVNSQGGTSRILGGIVSVPNESLGGYLGQSTTENSYGYAPNGIIYFNGSTTDTGTTYTTGDVIGLALNLDDGEINFYKNNTYIAQKTGLSGYYAFGAHAYNTSDNGTFNFGQDSSFAGNKTAQGNSDGNGVGDFYYSPPAGYLALCTANLPVPTIKDGTGYFNTVLYTGTGSSNSITGVGFQPDWVWIKKRSASEDHELQDSVRGATKRLASNSTAAETTVATTISSFDSDGFTVVSDATTNQNTATYAAWNWKAGGSSSSNSNGTITSTVSANVDAGFSIVSFTGTGSNATVGHGLGVAPSMFIVKDRSSAGSWGVYHSGLTSAAYYLILNQSAAQSNTSNFWNSTAPTSTVFSLGDNGTINSTGDTYIAYCFAEVEGFSKFGSYTGNGSADGVHAHTNFAPAFLMIKRTDAAGWWYMYDNKREVYNANDNPLYALSSNGESPSSAFAIDFLSSGFKIRNTDADLNVGDYIFMAFAEHPFKYANAR